MFQIKKRINKIFIRFSYEFIGIVAAQFYLSEKIFKMGPVAIFAILPVISIKAVLVNHLLRVFIFDLNKIAWHKFISGVGFAPLALGALLFLEPVLLSDGQLEGAIF